MKKIFALLALVLGVVSCQTEPEGLDVNVGGEQEVAICVTIPETETRAGGLNSALGVFDNGVLTTDATMRYILQVYYKTTENGEVKYTASKERLVKYSDGKSVTFPVRLVPKRDYQFVVWADVVDGENAGDKHYNTADLANVQLNRTWVAMDETRDAFTATQLVENYNSTSSINIILKRPFAKLRVVTTDMVALNNLGIKPTKATVTYSVDHYNAFNALAGNAIGDSKNRTIKHENFVIASYNENVTAGADMTLFTDYFFAEAGDVVKFELDVFDQNGVSIKKNNFNTDIAVQRNYLTTISGNILTDGNNVKVTVEDTFECKTEWPDKNNSSEQLAYAAMFGGEVALTEDVVLTQPLKIVEGANAVINLNGKTITGAFVKGKGAIIENNGTLTLVGGTIKNTETNGDAVINNNGELVLDGVKIEGAPIGTTNYPNYAVYTSGKLVVEEGTQIISDRGALSMVNGVDVTINGGEFIVTNAVGTRTLTAHVIYAYGRDSKLTINDGNFAMNIANGGGSSVICPAGATIKVYGGNFYHAPVSDSQSGCFQNYMGYGAPVDVYGGVFNDDTVTKSGNLAPGYYALQYETGKYTVQAFDAASRTLTINSKEDLLKLSLLNEKWNEFFSNGQGTDITDFWTANGGKGADFYYKWEWTIKLNADIDFEGATLNAPISVTKFGCFDGQNHTIKNVTIKNDTDAGLFVASSTKLQNIKLDNIHAIGGYIGNSNAGILASDCSAGIDNITITNSSVVGGKYTGGVVGYGYTYVTNCTLTNCVVKGGYKCGGVIGYICANSGANVTGNTLTGCTVEAAPQHADGKSEYVLGMVVGNYNCNGTCADNVVYDITTTATKIIGKIEGGKVVNESNNVVTYVVKNYNELKSAIIKGGNIEFANDITVDEWIMISEDYNVATGDIITVKDINVSIDGKGHTLTVNAIESAGNGGLLFQGADVLNISNLTIKCGNSVTTGGLGMDSGVIKNVHFIGGGYAIRPADGEIKVEDCIFDTNGVAIYFEDERDNLTVTGCTFNQNETYAIILRGNVKFTDNIINHGKVTVRIGSPVITGNDFKNDRFKVYGDATATISYNIINNLEFDGNPYASTFYGNTLSAAAQAVLDAATKAN